MGKDHSFTSLARTKEGSESSLEVVAEVGVVLAMLDMMDILDILV